MSLAVAPITYQNEAVAMPPKESYPKEAVRYVACLGDFIVPQDKIQLASVGARSGGLRVGASDTEGCPTMFRTDFMIRRGCFTPLEPTAIATRTDERNIDGKSIGQRQALPGDDMSLLSDDSHREMGIVEITPLRGEVWGTQKAINLNRHFFPDLDAWLNGTKQFPTLLKDYEEIVSTAVTDTDELYTIQQELLNGARVFRQYAQNQIDHNRARIEATKAIDMAGFTVGWQPRTRLFAEQLGVTLEDEREIKSSTVTTTDSEEMLDLRKKEIALKERELTLKEIELGVNQPVVVAPEPIEIITPVATVCGRPTAKGDCQRELKAGEDACWQHR